MGGCDSIVNGRLLSLADMGKTFFEKVYADTTFVDSDIYFTHPCSEKNYSRKIQIKLIRNQGNKSSAAQFTRICNPISI